MCAYENGNCRCTSGWTVYYGRRYDTGGRPGRGGQLPLGEVLLLEHKERVSSGASLRCSNSQFGGDPQALWYKVRALVDSLAPDNNISDRVQRRQPVAWLIDERLATSASAERENKSKRTLQKDLVPKSTFTTSCTCTTHVLESTRSCSLKASTVSASSSRAAGRERAH